MKRIIIVLSSGRSGTGKLASVLSTVPGVYAAHEESPCYSFALDMPAKRRMQFVETKLALIDAAPGDVYCDTSFLIGQGFIESFLSFGVVPDVIRLERPVSESALSYYQLGSIPGEPWNGYERNPYFILPGENGAPPLTCWDELSDYGKCSWFCAEMRRRALVYSKVLGAYGARVARIQTAELNDVDAVNRVLETLDLPTVSEVSHEIVNAKTEEKIPGR